MDIVERTGISREALIEKQNNFEFAAKCAAFATKEENLETDSNSLFDQMTKR
ncbi:hypothetical protein OEG92_05330 [Polaribacter sejongensis]